MNFRRYSFTTIATVFSLALLCLWGGSAAHAAKIPWAKTLDAAMAEAKKTNKLVMVDFYTDWCGWCKRLDKDVYPHPLVVTSAKKYVSVKVNAEREGLKAAQKYKVSSFPTILFLSPSGKVEGTIGGYAPAPRFAAEMDRIASDYRDLPGLAARIKSNPNDLTTAARYTRIQAGRGEVQAAQTGLAAVRKLDPRDAQGKLASSLNVVGEMLLNRSQPEKARPLFQQALGVGHKTQDIGYAHLMLAVSYLGQRNKNGAVKELNATLSDKRVSTEDKDRARGLLERLAAVP
jgi:thiol-disulfide isomerase/thioredoxin